MAKPGYKNRMKQQTLQWAMGNPRHNYIDNECCPDFSCCHPDMYETDEIKRWRLYRDHYGSEDTPS